MTDLNAAQRPRPQSRAQDILALAAFLAICLIAGGLGTLATTPNIPTWYAGLTKPSFNPPNSLFPVVWTVLYILMAVAAWIVWRERHKRPGIARQSSFALVPFFIQLVLNVAWSFAFFGAHNPFFGLVVIAILLASILWTIAAFWPIARGAALLLVPYAAWVTFAAILNGAIYELN
jgi:tryptophan-rich sensory protein